MAGGGMFVVICYSAIEKQPLRRTQWILRELESYLMYAGSLSNGRMNAQCLRQVMNEAVMNMLDSVPDELALWLTV